ncbi:ribonuclease HI family protein [candidate division TA06 bacterium]|uniref:Ribonuclease HI family protein n=1 Tax=candidate division TA06 bacterium TaxID=2250710 RepID=A0A523XGW1_UNCT6|nr:MAG: ribonuclease HI family protein [candidate division TA06 bacterium]
MVGFSSGGTGTRLRLSLYIDGASKGNPGRASVGVVIRDARGKVISEVSRSIGRATNNQAEYKALLYGLEEVSKITDNRPGNVDLLVRTDSQLLYRQMTGRYRIRNKILIGISVKVQTRLKQLGSFNIEHIPREQNTYADRLANLALRKRSC